MITHGFALRGFNSSLAPNGGRMPEDVGVHLIIEDNLVVAERSQSRMNIDDNNAFGVGKIPIRDRPQGRVRPGIGGSAVEKPFLIRVLTLADGSLDSFFPMYGLVRKSV